MFLKHFQSEEQSSANYPADLINDVVNNYYSTLPT